MRQDRKMDIVTLRPHILKISKANYERSMEQAYEKLYERLKNSKRHTEIELNILLYAYEVMMAKKYYREIRAM